MPSGWTILLSVLYLAVMVSWYFDPGQSGQVDSMCTGLTLNYIFLLAFISTFILRLILNFSWEDTTCGVIFTFMVSAIAYIASMFEVNYKEWSWLIFQFKRFGMRPSSAVSLSYSDDKQDWGIQYGMSMLVHLLATVFTAICIKYGNSVFDLSLKDYPVLSSIGLILSVTCWLIFIAFYMTTKDKHKYKKLVYFNRASLFIIVYAYSIVTKSVVFLCVSLTIALLKLLVSKVFKYSIKEQVSRNVNLANIYPSILVLSVDMMLIKTSVKASLLIGAVTLVIFIMLAAVTKTQLFEVQEGFGYKLLGDAKFTDIDVNKSILCKVCIRGAICVSLIYFSIFSIYALVFKDISIIYAIPRIFGVFIFLLIVVTTFITLSKKEEKE
jgi:membrane protein